MTMTTISSIRVKPEWVFFICESPESCRIPKRFTTAQQPVVVSALTAGAAPAAVGEV